MRMKVLAVVAASVMLAAAAFGTAAASPEPQERASYFKSKVTPKSGVTSGTTLTLKGKGAKRSTSYYCLLAVYDADGGDIAAPLISSATAVTSTARGKVTCRQTYRPFSARDDNGVMRHCPTTRADRRANFKCGVVLADAATEGALSASAAPFSPAR